MDQKTVWICHLTTISFLIAGCAQAEIYNTTCEFHAEPNYFHANYFVETIQIEKLSITPEEVERKANPLIEVFWAKDEFLEVDGENQRWAVSVTRDIFGLDESTARRIAFIADQEVRFSFLEAGFVNWGHAEDRFFINSLIYEEALSPKKP